VQDAALPELTFTGKADGQPPAAGEAAARRYAAFDELLADALPLSGTTRKAAGGPPSPSRPRCRVL
jgi:hypothetical protein